MRFFFIVWSIISKPLDPNQLAQNIRQWGPELSLQQAGVTDTDPSAPEPGLQAQLDRRYHDEMGRMVRHGVLCVHPYELLPGALRVISVRMSHLPANATFANTLGNPKLGYASRHALGCGYHELLHNQLKKLGEIVQQHYVSLNFKPFTDFTPVLECPLAEKVGLGWTGKHSLTLSRKAGSFFLLGESPIDIPLPTDQPVEEECSKCMVRITICPAGIIIEPYTANVRHYISYLTTELERTIPEELRPLMGNRIYNCNDCQLTCPWNRYPQLITEDDFSPREPLHAPEFIELFTWNEEQFLKAMGGSATRHIGHLR